MNSTLASCIDIKKRINNTFNELIRKDESKVAFYGTGDLAELASMLLQNTTLELVAVIDHCRCGEVFNGIKIMGPSQLSNLHYDRIIVTLLDNNMSIEQIADGLKVPLKKIKVLY